MERCHLKARPGTTQLVKGIGGLDTPISAVGSLSAGERQLVALARAILRGSQVVVLDEATSQIDTVVDDAVRVFDSSNEFKLIVLQIQRTIREELANAMVRGTCSRHLCISNDVDRSSQLRIV